MLRQMLRGKIHRATVTGTQLHYAGSIEIDRELVDAAGMLVGERVQVVNLMNGERFETYIIEGERGSGAVCLKGPAARLAETGDTVIIISYALCDDAEARVLVPKVVRVDDRNRIV
ncbi:MAG TPA: aspartate 1-decarboxylase [Planctomycetota bacterium]|nr:aspartate 1-decarboxylase [Planctomycetota bacterium]